jgi:hypothetical protein
MLHRLIRGARCPPLRSCVITEPEASKSGKIRGGVQTEVSRNREAAGNKKRSIVLKIAIDVINFLQQMRSVLIPGTTGSFEQATPKMHKFFRDYIMTERAPPGFRILTRSQKQSP